MSKGKKREMYSRVSQIIVGEKQVICVGRCCDLNTKLYR